MKLMSMGDHYVWFCEWCDTRNMTLWTRVEENQLCCAACHKKFSAFAETRPSRPPGGPARNLPSSQERL